jgi:hypothetical protein
MCFSPPPARHQREDYYLSFYFPLPTFVVLAIQVLSKVPIIDIFK